MGHPPSTIPLSGLFFPFLSFSEKERKHEQRGGLEEGHRERESKAGYMPSTDPNAGLDLMTP